MDEENFHSEIKSESELIKEDYGTIEPGNK